MPATPYADVNTALRTLEAAIREILQQHLVGMYLYGSLALGDFDPASSDIDFLVLTDGELGDELFAALSDLHERFDTSGSPWAARIEAAYIPRTALRHSGPTAERYPQIEKGKSLSRDPLEIGWAFQRQTLHQSGLTVSGPDPRTLIEPVDMGDLRRASEALARTWLEQARNDPSWIAWIKTRSEDAFVVLTLCRLLYTLRTGRIASKPATAAWVLKTQGERWADLIDRSLRGIHDKSETSGGDVAETVALIEYVLRRSQE